MKKKLKRVIALFVISATLIISSTSFQVQADRVSGRGYNATGADDYRTYNYLDTTVTPPLSSQWSKPLSSPIPSYGAILTNYRLYYGSGNTFFGTSDQTGLDADVPKTQDYNVGKPFSFELSSYYGPVSSDTAILWLENGGNLLFGTANGFVGRVTGWGLYDKQNQQTVSFSNDLGDAVKYIGDAGSGQYFAAASDTRVTIIDTGLGKHGGFSVDSGGRFTGITRISGHAGFGVSSDHGDNLGYLYFYEWTTDDPNKTTYDKKLTYYAGLLKHVAYDNATGYIYAVDKKGRFYKNHYSDTGYAKVFSYAGNASNRGFRSVGGVLLNGGYAYVSTETSYNSSNVEVWQGTITKINTSTGSKSYYVHPYSITTTPIMLNGLLYFGDSYGKVWALNPSTMQLVKNINIENGIYYDYFNIGERVDNIVGADNHLIVFSQHYINAFKGQPDYYVAAQKVGTTNLNGYRVNFYNSTLPTINITQTIGNKGTFDYSIYTDFGGSNTQTTSFQIHRTNDWYSVPINTSLITNNVPDNYKDENVLYTNNPQRFQIPVNGAFNLYYSFTPPSEGKYRLRTIANEDKRQNEFDVYGSNQVDAYFDVVDMRNPNTWTSKSSYRPNEDVVFGLSKTQTFSYSSYLLQVKNPSGTVIYSSSGTTFPSSLTMTGKTGTPGRYSYQLSIKNTYGDTLYSGWKYFDVVNQAPIAGFNTNKTTYYLNEIISVTSTASDSDGDSLTFSYTIKRPDGTTFTNTNANFSFTATQRGTYTITQVVKDPYGASATLTKTVQVVNRSPIAGFVIDKPYYYIGDNMVITSTASDPDGDPLTYSYVVTRPNGTTFTNTNANFSFKTDQIGYYTIKQTVNDGHGGTAVASLSVEVRDLSIIGHVNHTPDWEQKHTAKGHTPEQFYSGEKFLVAADVVDQPINYVKVEFFGNQVNGRLLYLSTNLQKVTNIYYTGEVYDESMIDPSTMLQTGPVTFKFTVEYANGTVKTNIVNVEIIGSVYDAFQLYRSY
ncbi:Ig-like domain-containing protein [Tepidibacillus fermentans]|uniref:PKD/Chitinase domain-containing protein n=1 Tax=Tepidibacillus fermentans TaxID=1281767 RepID=A0A4R3KKY5_9BACI|nr:cadherin-like domain-containing protein [Tepidibacillus fermentans]TCS84553.1 hypothetical protein EDD72_101222 [Tepidibacillus fermentans]